MISFFRKAMQHFLHDMKFKNKFIIINLILVLVPTFVVFCFLYGRLSHIITTNAINSEQALVSQTAETLAATVNQLELTMESITTDMVLTDITHTFDVHSYLDSRKNHADTLNYFKNIQPMIDRDFITAVRIYVPYMKESFDESSPFHLVQPASLIERSYWHGIFDGSPDTEVLLCPDFYLTKSEIQSLGSMAYIRKIRTSADPADECCYIAIYFSSEYLKNILCKNLTGTGSVYYLNNSRNSIVTSSNTALAGTYFMRYETIPERIGSTQNFTAVTILNENLYMGYREVEHTDWRLVSVIPTNSVFSESRQILLNTVFLYLFFVALAYITALLLSGNIANRLSLVVDKMNEDRDKTPVKFDNEDDKDEIGQLVCNYNAMVDRINTLMAKETETAEKLKVSEVKALQAQINPHFLYNMLDMINWLAQSGKQKEVSIAVQTLSRFYKLTLSKKNITVPIQEELWHVELFVKLQNMRYENRINFLIDVPDEILDFEIPKLVLQPIVENSIQHGIFERESKSGDVVIMVWLEDGDILFTISDTGMGIPPQQLVNILDGTGAGSGSNIGIYNTHQRLQLLYGERYGLQYQSAYGDGTEVHVRIPAIKYREKTLL